MKRGDTKLDRSFSVDVWSRLHLELRDVEILPIGTLVHKWCFMILAIVPPKSWPLDHVEGVAWLKMATPNLLHR